MDWPASYDSIAGFLCRQVERLDESAKSISNTHSALKNYALLNNLVWLNDTETIRVKHIIDLLWLRDQTPTKRSKPATIDCIMQVIGILRLDSSHQYLLTMSMLLAHNALLRSGELLSGLLVGDIVWDHVNYTFVLSLKRTKTHRKGGSLEIHIFDYVGPSAYKSLKQWFDLHNLWNNPSYYLLPKISSRTDRISWHEQLTNRVWITRLKLYFKLAGLPSGYTGHAFRAGGATDLFLADLNLHEVQKFGY